MESSSRMYLIDIALEELRHRKIILPAISTIERAVWTARKNAEESIFQILTQSLTLTQKNALESLLERTNGSIPLYWLKKSPGYSSPKTFLKIIEKLEKIRSLKLDDINIKEIPLKRIKYLSRLGAGVLLVNRKKRSLRILYKYLPRNFCKLPVLYKRT